MFTAVGFLVTLVGGYYSVRSQMEIMNSKIESLADESTDIKRELKVQTEILVRMGQYEVELRGLRDQVSRINSKHIS